MSESLETAEGLITFDDTLDITLAATYYEQLGQLLNQHKSIALNAENIERIDGAGLQLLVAFFQAAEFLDISIQWQGCSDTLKKSAQLSGLSGSLGIE